MALLPTQELWRASIQGRPDLFIEVGHVRMRAWECWSHARAPGSNDPANPEASRWLVVERVAVAMVEMPELAVA